MSDEPRSNRPTPRTAAAIEAELRRRIRGELEQARSEADGALDDAALAGIIARAIASALDWHLQSPEHTRNATMSSRTWRPAAGPRGGARDDEEERGPRRPPRDFDRPPRDFDRPPRRDFDRGPRRDFDRPPRDFDRPPRDFDRPPRDYDRPRPPRDYDGPPRDDDRDADGPRRNYDRPPRDYNRGPRRPPPRGGGGFKRGGFGPRKPPKR
jgi:hypothetical protein